MSKTQNENFVYIGLPEISKVMRRSPSTIRRWAYNQAFPACHLPNGRWCTTRSLIDKWVLAKAQVEMDARMGNA